MFVWYTTNRDLQDTIRKKSLTLQSFSEKDMDMHRTKGVGVFISSSEEGLNSF